MACYLSVDEDKSEYMFFIRPERGITMWYSNKQPICNKLIKGSIKKLIGRELTWLNNPVELKEE